MRTIVSGLLAVLGFSDLYAALPVISSASLSSGTVKVSGANFGQKAVAAPHKFQPFTSTSQGQTYSQAGFDFVGGNNQDTQHNYCDTTDGVGGGSWMHVTLGGGHESFSHFGHFMPPKTTSLYTSYWVKLRRLTNAAGGRGGQFKGVRSGSLNGRTDAVANMYRVNPKYTFSIFTDVANLSALSGPNAFVNAVAGEMVYYPEGRYDVPFVSGSWVFCEVYYRFNTVGQADGIQQIRFNGTQHADLRDRLVRTLPTEFMDYVQYSPGLANDFMQSVWEVRFSRIYTDTTRSRVFLGNASTLAACKGRFLLPPTAWSDTSVSAGSAVKVPAGYNWVYVSNWNGEINERGYPLPGTISGSVRGGTP